jgi:arginine utilization protein RocB
MMKVARAAGAIFTLLFATAAAAQVPAVNWEKQKVEILRHYRSLVQIDTSNPPGNETKAAEYLKKVFDAEGIPAKTFALEASRANLVARLKGNGSKRPILLMAHTDVVGLPTFCQAADLRRRWWS